MGEQKTSQFIIIGEGGEITLTPEMIKVLHAKPGDSIDMEVVDTGDTRFLVMRRSTSRKKKLDKS